MVIEMSESELATFREGLPEEERHEYYRFLAVRWDIVKARYLLEKYKRAPRLVDVASAARVYGLDRPQEENSAFYVDEERVMQDTIDPGIPLIAALIQIAPDTPASPLLLDGLHRLRKAYLQGKVSMYCYILSPQEELCCRI